jgi:hypothetical protein
VPPDQKVNKAKLTEILNVCKNDFIQGAGQLGKNDVTLGHAISTNMSPNQKCKQSRLTNLSPYKHL